MLELFLMLVEKLVELAKAYKRRDPTFHDRFLEPMMKQFEFVHQQYVDKFFQEYRRLVASDAPHFYSDNPVFARLENDAIFSDASRKTLSSMSRPMNDILGSRWNRSTDDPVIAIIASVQQYISAIAGVDSGLPGYNIGRRGLADLLEDLATCGPELKADFEFKTRLNEFDGVDFSTKPKTNYADDEIVRKIAEMVDLHSAVKDRYHRAKGVTLK